MKMTNPKTLFMGRTHQTKSDRRWRRACSSVICMLPLLAACGGLTPAGSAAKIMKGDPPAECEELGDVNGSAMGFCDLECQKLRMRNEAGELGANYVRYEVAAATGSTGTAFRCPERSEPARHGAR
jgi:hypothetical protein